MVPSGPMVGLASTKLPVVKVHCLTPLALRQ